MCIFCPPSVPQSRLRRNFLFKVAALAGMSAAIPILMPWYARGEWSTEATRQQQRENIETNFFATLERSYLISPEISKLIAKSKGVLVFPAATVADPLTGSKMG